MEQPCPGWPVGVSSARLSVSSPPARSLALCTPSSLPTQPSRGREGGRLWLAGAPPPPSAQSPWRGDSRKEAWLGWGFIWRWRPSQAPTQRRQRRLQGSFSRALNWPLLLLLSRHPLRWKCNTSRWQILTQQWRAEWRLVPSPLLTSHPPPPQTGPQ